MAARVLHVALLRRKKADDAKSTQAIIDSELDEIAKLAEVITEAAENRKQGDLHFGDIEAEAKEILGTVAKKLEERHASTESPA